MLCLSFKWIQIAQMCAKATRLRLIGSALMPQSELCWDFSLTAKIPSTSAERQPLGGEAVKRDRKQTVVNKGHSGEWGPLLCWLLEGCTGPDSRSRWLPTERKTAWPGSPHYTPVVAAVVVQRQQDKWAFFKAGDCRLCIQASAWKSWHHLVVRTQIARTE